MIFDGNKKLLQKLDLMLDEALAGTFSAASYDESLVSKIESKMARFLEQSRLRREQIEGEQEHVRSFISDISHQLKTPLANIVLYAQLLREQNLTDEQSILAGQITAGTEKLNFLIQALVKTSRLESGIVKLAPKPGDVYELIKTAATDCEPLVDRKKMKLSVAVGTAPIMALFDARWCVEALFNMIDNAVKYTPENGSISISVSEYEMFVRIDITDTGRGIREEDLPKIFGRFWRAAESADSPGVGIGLYLAREIITTQGGYIKVCSQVGKGSTFSVFLSKM
ncbi:MAG: HAMP domain-containing histidine kinase [Clostridiales Family XIII bacterium]|jgi:signal transduction histidine kinase|nr:HAMP domain-containing histidine kinase [Clostridiales Family XIII bacterium]